jgi:MarR family transcriptional repressor of emrRAB
MNDARLENLLGALGFAISDRVNAASQALLGFGGEAAAAIVQTGTAPGLTILTLSRTINLSHSATTRIVAKLVQQKLMQKQHGEDGREVLLRLTGEGEQVMADILASRQAEISRLVSKLGQGDRRLLEQLVDKMLSGVPDDDAEALQICRLCDEQACPQDTCPVTPAAHA